MTKENIFRPMKWVFALALFIFVMTVNYSEAEGVQITSNVSTPATQNTADMNADLTKSQPNDNQISASGSVDPIVEPTGHTSAVPEPATFLIMSLGLIALQANRLRKLYQ